MTRLTKHKHFKRSLKLSKGDVRLPKLFRQTVPQRWTGVAKEQSPNWLRDDIGGGTVIQSGSVNQINY